MPAVLLVSRSEAAWVAAARGSGSGTSSVSRQLLIKLVPINTRSQSPAALLMPGCGVRLISRAAL
jgi:hypothetical protein